MSDEFGTNKPFANAGDRATCGMTRRSTVGVAHCVRDQAHDGPHLSDIEDGYGEYLGVWQSATANPQQNKKG